MRAVHSVLIAAALAAAVPAFAQQPRIEERLSASEFQAAGLGKLSDAELSRLNELLARDTAATSDGDVAARIRQAREEGRQEAQQADRGLRPAAESREPIASSIPGTFVGFARGREYTLANGQVWRQTDGASIAGARGQDIGARLRPSLMGGWWLKVDGYNTEARVERVR